MPSPFSSLKPNLHTAKIEAWLWHFSFEMADSILLHCLFSIACMCLCYLTAGSHSCLIFSYLEPLALVRLGHALSCSHDFPYAVPSLWNAFPPTVFLMNVHSTVKSQVNLTSLERNPGALGLMYTPFATLAGTEIIILLICLPLEVRDSIWFQLCPE